MDEPVVAAAVPDNRRELVRRFHLGHGGCTEG